ncbi:hypothetical protein AAMO2058_001001200 [Amorphochlora amoebiformis]
MRRNNRNARLAMALPLGVLVVCLASLSRSVRFEYIGMTPGIRGKRAGGLERVRNQGNQAPLHHPLPPMNPFLSSKIPSATICRAEAWEQRAKSRDAKKASKSRPKAKPTAKPQPVGKAGGSQGGTPSRRGGYHGGKGKSPVFKEERRRKQMEENVEKLAQAMDAAMSTSEPVSGVRGAVRRVERVEDLRESPHGNGGGVMMVRGEDGKVTDWAVDERSLEVLEFDTLKEALLVRCKTHRGQIRARNCLDEAAGNAKEARKAYKPVEEVMRLGGGDAVPILNGMVMGSLLEKVVDRFPLELDELASVGEALSALIVLEDWLNQVRDGGPPAPNLLEIAKDIHIDAEIRELFDGAFDGESLSREKFPHLKSLQDSIDKAERSIRSQMDSLVKSQEFDGMLESKSIDRINGRFVLSVKPNFKRRVGIAHDSSRTGKTLYIEPFQVIEGTNAMIEAGRLLRQEEAKILSNMQALLLKNSKVLFASLEGSASVDLVRAKAILANDMGGGVIPEICEEGSVSLRNVRHPLLALRGIEVVPNSVSLNSSYPGLVITGPNAGGKTIVLKTLGLSALMARLAMPIPCGPASQVGIFTNIIANIGDSQTALGDLSTFSGHLSIWANALQRAGEKSLFLMDEMGTGTDPTQGAAIAQAMLEAFADEGARIVVTTHYGQIKEFAASDERFRVAGMNIVNGNPTYKIMDGFASESHAIAIAERMDINKSVVERAKSLVDSNTRDLLSLMDQLQHARDRAETRERDLAVQQSDLETLKAEVKKKTIELEQTRRIVRSEAAAEYAKELKVKENKLNSLVKDLQKKDRKNSNSPAGNLQGEDIASLKIIQKQVMDTKAEVREESRIQLEKEGYSPIKDNEVLKKGEMLAIIDGGTFDKRLCTVERVKGNKVDVTVTRGRIPFRLTVGRADLGRPSERVLRIKAPLTRQTGSISRSFGQAGKKKSKTPQLKGIRVADNTVDVRGMSLTEAQEEVLSFLKVASSRGLSLIYIAHGHGTGEAKGVVKNGLRAWLTNGVDQVSAFHAAALEDGGDAYTIVGLNGS